MTASEASVAIDGQAIGIDETPVCRFDLARLSVRLETLTAAAERVGIRLAYSMKTNPSREVLRLVHAGGMLAEAINLAEVDLALHVGWTAEEIVLNGPAKRWRGSADSIEHTGLHSSMCDCVEELSEWFLTPSFSSRVGVRLKAVDSGSRFGIDLSIRDEMDAVEAAARRAQAQQIPVALHFHANSIWRGLDWWLTSVEQTFSAAGAISGLREVTSCIDLGGGWNEAGLDAVLLEERIAPVLLDLRRQFPMVREFYVEPGEGLVGGCGQVVARVVREPRKLEEHLEVVVDASVAELPFRIYGVRPVFHERAAGEWQRISGRGSDVIHGRSCMERDLLAIDVDLSEVRRGDLIVFGDAGSYDVSLRTSFGSGNHDGRVVYVG